MRPNTALAILVFTATLFTQVSKYIIVLSVLSDKRWSKSQILAKLLHAFSINYPN